MNWLICDLNKIYYSRNLQVTGKNSKTTSHEISKMKINQSGLNAAPPGA
jgi:hypothetical protein